LGIDFDYLNFLSIFELERKLKVKLFRDILSNSVPTWFNGYPVGVWRIIVLIGGMTIPRKSRLSCYSSVRLRT